MRKFDTVLTRCTYLSQVQELESVLNNLAQNIQGDAQQQYSRLNCELVSRQPPHCYRCLNLELAGFEEGGEPSTEEPEEREIGTMSPMNMSEDEAVLQLACACTFESHWCHK